MSIQREKIEAISFKKNTIAANTGLIKPFTGKIPELPKKQKAKIMFRIKSKVISWAISAIATIPEEQVFQFLNKIIEKLEQRFENRSGLRKVLEVFKAVLTAVGSSSDGGRTITKAEFKQILEKVW